MSREGKHRGESPSEMKKLSEFTKRPQHKDQTVVTARERFKNKAKPNKWEDNSEK